MQEPQQKIIKHEAVSLLEELTAAYQHISVMKITTGELSLLEALDSPNSEISAKVTSQIHDWGKKLQVLLVKDDRFPGNSVRIVRGDGGGSGFYPNFVGVSLVRIALQTGSPEAAIAWLQKVLATTTATGKTIHALWGVPVEQEIQLTPQVKIVPIDELPDSVQKRRITEGSYYQNMSLVMPMLNYEQPQSALMIDRQIKPFIYDPDVQQNFNKDEYLQTNELLLDVTLALTVVGPRVPISAAQWFTFDDPDLEKAGISSGIRRSQMLEILPNQSSDYPVLDPVEASQIVQAYLALHIETRDKVRVALQRLNQAQRRRNIGDRAVELSIAFETLLGDNANTEMTHKIKVRSVRLIGGTDKVRKKNAAIINKAYDIRSKLVHKGAVKTAKSVTIDGQPMSPESIIDHAILLCADLTKIIIRRGSIPNWADFDIAEQPRTD